MVLELSLPKSGGICYRHKLTGRKQVGLKARIKEGL
jgi:hypothetical protein